MMKKIEWRLVDRTINLYDFILGHLHVVSRQKRGRLMTEDPLIEINMPGTQLNFSDKLRGAA